MQCVQAWTVREKNVMSSNYVITGGTSGIGKAIVHKILEDSKDLEDKVVVNYGHNDARAKEFFQELPEEDQKKVLLIKGDLSTYEGMTGFVGKVTEEVPHVDYLICNTGIGTYKKFAEYTMEDWNHVMDTNISIPAFMIRSFLDIMVEEGSIILMGSYAGIVPYSSSVVYSVSKAALIFLAEVLVKELEPKAIRINSIAPGFIETEWQKDRNQESRDRVNNKIALHRFGTPQEVADLCCSMMKNTYLNGSVINIHGGYNYF